MGVYNLPKDPSAFFDKLKYGPYNGLKKQPGLFFELTIMSCQLWR
jgi:hypothetical protein